MKLERAPAVAALLCALSTSCSSSLTLQERYDMMGPESQAAFIAYYPRLTPMEREAMADHANEYLRRWKIEQDEIRSKIEVIPSYADRPKSYTLTGLEVIPSLSNPVKEGTELGMRAILHYADGRTADATNDVVWKVFPALARLEDGRLRFDCASSDVILAADFLRETRGATTIRFRKPIRSLSVDLDGSSKVLVRRDEFQLALQAECLDGTKSEVGCQAEWKSGTPGVEIHGCGSVRITDPSIVPGGRFEVTATYGSLLVTRILHAPLLP